MNVKFYEGLWLETYFNEISTDKKKIKKFVVRGEDIF